MAILGADRFAKHYTATPECRAEADLLTVLAVHQVPARLDRYNISFMADVDSSTFSEQVVQGIWGDPGGYGIFPWWPFTEIWGRLTTQRRAELEVIAGHSLG